MSLDPDTIRDGGEQDYPEYLLQKNQVATEDNLELFQAALRGSVTDCDRLLRRGAKPNFFYRPEDHKNAIHVAAEKGFYEVCKVLIHGGAEVNSIAAFDHSSPLTLAAFNDDADLIKLLVDHGAHINHGALRF
jgi:ankyrin repeat protein